MAAYSKLIFIGILVLSCLRSIVATAKDTQSGFKISPYKRAPLQDIVTWDEHSIFVRGERVLFFSGEFHPFRLPVPSLWPDVLQKIRSLGFTGVSFYVDWALLEGKPGEYSAEGVFALEPFFEAASKAGLYLLARPGPYINAEVSGGGFPGWLQRLQGTLRTNDTDYLAATENYVTSVLQSISKAQITNGGPVILVQPENEYSEAVSGYYPFPNADYMSFVEEQFRNNGIVVPLISNDVGPDGHNAPGQPAPVDIYGHDGYPLGFDCSNPASWKTFNTNWRTLHLQQSPTTPYAIVEFQGGSFDPWGGVGFDKCLSLVNSEFERVYYKNNYGFGLSIYNIYMIFGGTNWGNLGHPGGYTSYDYGSPISEDRSVAREKYSELKLQANFIVGSPAFLTAVPGAPSTTLYTTSADLYVTPLKSNQTQFYVVSDAAIRHSTFNSTSATTYKLTLGGTSIGNITVPQLAGALSLNGRDSKIHVSDYDIGGAKLIYSTAEIFTWQKYDDSTVLVVYGGPGEQHELAIARNTTRGQTIQASPDLRVESTAASFIVNWQATSTDQYVRIGDLQVYIVDRDSAYNFWVVPVPGSEGTLYTKTEDSNLIIKSGYLIRSANATKESLDITGDLNATSPLWIAGGAPKDLRTLTFNGKEIDFSIDRNGAVLADLVYTPPDIDVPVLQDLDWYYIDTLPEVQVGYDDSQWTLASLSESNNTNRALTTPTSLYASDYGYHAGTLIYRGKFIANGDETTVHFQTQGGLAFGSSVFFDGTFLGSTVGNKSEASANATLSLPQLNANETYVFTIVIDNMGLDEEWTVGSNTMKAPRGVLDYDLSGHDQSDVTWKLTGNLGGEDYIDHVRGPLNEGGLWAERQGYHLPDPPVSTWSKGASPADGIDAPGIGFFTTSFDLDLPEGYDIPISVRLGDLNSTSALRVQIYVNGWQFGKYVANIGPQTEYPIPEGIWNYHGQNWLAISLWSLDSAGGKVDSIELVASQAVETGRQQVELVDSPGWSERPGALQKTEKASSKPCSVIDLLPTDGGHLATTSYNSGAPKPGTVSLPAGASSVVVRISNPQALVNHETRTENEVAAMILMRDTLSSYSSQLIPEVYDWSSSSPVANSGFGYILQAQKHGVSLDSAFGLGGTSAPKYSFEEFPEDKNEGCSDIFNMLFDVESNRLTALLDFDFSHVATPADEYFYSMGLLGHLLLGPLEHGVEKQWAKCLLEKDERETFLLQERKGAGCPGKY
ncbi:putative Beta-galactosidase [Seiridium cardinale]